MNDPSFQRALRIGRGLAAAACVIFAAVCANEVSYVSGHSDGYGPAAVIAWAAFAGALVSAAVAVVAHAALSRTG